MLRVTSWRREPGVSSDEMVITFFIYGEYDAVIIKVLFGEYHHLFKSSMMLI